MATTWSYSSNEVSATWYSLESMPYGFMFWESIDDVNWEDITESSLYPEEWEEFG